jgi:hypothetical protein
MGEGVVVAAFRASRGRIFVAHCDLESILYRDA